MCAYEWKRTISCIDALWTVNKKKISKQPNKWTDEQTEEKEEENAWEWQMLRFDVIF